MKALITVLLAVSAVSAGLHAKDAQPKPEPEPARVLVTGVVVAFADETKENYGCALVETSDNVYEAVWYPLTQRDNVTMDGVFNFFCKKAPSTFKPVVFKTKEWTTKNEVETLNPKKGDAAHASTIVGTKSLSSHHSSRRAEIIGDEGSTVSNHIYGKQLIAVGPGPNTRNE